MSIDTEQELMEPAPDAETRPRIGPDAAGLLMAPEEFDAIEAYDELHRYELVHGVLVVNPIPLPAERRPNDLLGHMLLRYQESNAQGSCIDDTLYEEYIRLPTGRRRADRVIWVGLGRVPNPEVDVPTIAIEFVSRGKRNFIRDYEEKQREYMAVGVVEYWIVDRFRRTMTVYRNQGGTVTMEVIPEKGVYSPALLPGFELRLAELLVAADR